MSGPDDKSKKLLHSELIEAIGNICGEAEDVCDSCKLMGSRCGANVSFILNVIHAVECSEASYTSVESIADVQRPSIANGVVGRCCPAMARCPECNHEDFEHDDSCALNSLVQQFAKLLITDHMP